MDPSFLETAIALATKNVRSGAGGPFGAVIVKNGVIVAQAANAVTTTNDPTAHAEISAIRKACGQLNHYRLEGCEIYSSCEPCPMCLGAIYWAHLDAVYYANTRAQAAAAGFDDSFLYDQLRLPLEERVMKMIHLPMPTALDSFKEWQTSPTRVSY